MDHIAIMAQTPAALAFIDGLGGPEMVLVFVLVLILFGGKKLPEFARGLGKTMREFKKAAAGVEDEFKRALEEDERKRFAPPPPLAIQPVATLSSGEAAKAAADQDSATEPLGSTSDYGAGPDATFDEQTGSASPSGVPEETPAAPAPEPSSAPEDDLATESATELDPDGKRRSGQSSDTGVPPD